jgi:hypothetical protein
MTALAPNTTTSGAPHALTLGDRVRATYAMRGASPAIRRNALTPSGHDLSAGAKVDPTCWAPLALEQVRDDIRTRLADDEPTDVIRSLQTWHVDFRGHEELPAGRLAGRYMTSKGFSEPVAFTRRALRQFCGDVLPGRGLGFLDALTRIPAHAKGGPSGAMLATMNLATFVRAADDLRARNVRLYRRDLGDGRAGLVARAVVSESYVTYSDLELVEALLSEPSMAQLPVLAYTSTDSGLRLRMAMEPMSGAPEVGKPIQMLEAWNSEVGETAVTLKGGLWTFVCTNGLAGFEPGLVRRWNHSGRRDRIAKGVPEAVDELRVRASGLLDRYTAALDVGITDAMAWMDEMLADTLSDERIERAKVALLDDANNAAPMGSLARVVNAVTWTAQAEPDLFAAEQVEHAGAKLIARGLQQARNGVIRVAEA